jgi:hypothetical protein
MLCSSLESPHPGLKGGVESFNEDILVAVNGHCLIGLTLAEAVEKLQVITGPSRRVSACRFFDSLAGALTWTLDVMEKRKKEKGMGMIPA